jgi:hypothetical protein
MLRFSDGVNIDTSGELRVLSLHDGLYVVGEGICFPVDSQEEAEQTIRDMKARKEKGPKTDDEET